MTHPRPATAAAVLLALFAGSLAPAGVCIAQSTKLDPAAMERSLDLGRQFLLKAQRPDGSFIYEIDAVTGNDLGTRHAIRETGGLWALAVLHRRSPTPETAAAVTKALKLQDTFARRTAAGGRYLCEPSAREWTTHSMALYALALSDFLAADHELDPAFRAKCERDHADTVKFLVSLRLSSGRFSAQYRCADGRGTLGPTPYSDGETLLALVRAARAMDDAGTADGADGSGASADGAGATTRPTPPLRAIVLESAAAMYGEYVRAELRIDPDSEKTKGFYQWGSMAFHELYGSGWPGTQPYAARTIAMARWMIDVQRVLDRGGNAGYAYEGLAVAWDLARQTNDAKNQQHIGAALDRGLSKLLTWQIGSPIAGPAVMQKLKSAKALGGIVSEPGDRRIRIDVVQHQLHATLLARMLMFRPDEAASGR